MAAVDSIVSGHYRMTSVTEITAALQTILASSPNEHDVLQALEKKLQLLRGLYRAHRSEFTAEIIGFLKGLAPVEQALREFIDGLQDKEWVRTRDDAEDLASRFHDIADSLGNHFVRKRVEKEIRELVEKAKSLPLVSAIEADAEQRQRIARLEEKAPNCQKCNCKMVLRESQHGYFWGCSTFPKCFGKRWLSKNEAALLSIDR